MTEDPTPADAPPHEHERELRESIQARLEVQIVAGASSALAVAIEKATRDDRRDEAVARAILMATIRAFRAVRSATCVAEAGYEIEADAMLRVLIELYVAATEIIADASGDRARAFLEHGPPKGIGNRVAKAMGERETYGAFSNVAHGDPRALLRLAVPTGAQMTIDWGPNHTRRLGPLLAHLAIAARDFVVLLEQVGFSVEEEVDLTDQVLSAAIEGWSPFSDWSKGGS